MPEKAEGSSFAEQLPEELCAELLERVVERLQQDPRWKDWGLDERLFNERILCLNIAGQLLSFLAHVVAKEWPPGYMNKLLNDWSEHFTAMGRCVCQGDFEWTLSVRIDKHANCEG